MRLSVPGLHAMRPTSVKASLRALRGYFAHHGVWSLGVRLLRRLSMRDKILVVFGLVFLPLLPMAVYVVTTQTRAVSAAHERMAGAQLLVEVFALSDLVRDTAHQIDRGRAVDPSKLSPAILRLRQSRLVAEDSGLLMPTQWESLEPALARLQASAAASNTGRMEALALADQALVRLRATALQRSGLLLSDSGQKLYQSALTYIHLPQAADEVSQLMRAVRAYLAVQDSQLSELPRLPAQLLAVEGRVQTVEQVVKSIQRIANSGELNENLRPSADALKHLTALLGLVRQALQNDAYLSADELVAIRSTEEAAFKELVALRDVQMQTLSAQHEADQHAAQMQRTLSLLGALVSLAAALYLFYALYLVMRGGLDTLKDHMSKMATGDLRQPKSPLGTDEVALTMQAMAQSVQHLSELLAQVRHGSSSVSHAAEQIAMGNGDLRSRNRRTGDSLQKVVDGVARYSVQLEACGSQVERVAHTVQNLRLQSARSRRQMDSLREMLAQVRANSQQIGAAVALIDNVAFRTNVLALNASIEAAKAGEAGKGFAVVAQEVRGLAQRSAEAARRINGIVATSASEVEQSAQLADDTGRAIAESDGHIDLIHGAMGDVATLTREGQRESGAILDQVRELRETTEKNLGLVEQLANASYSLRSHGERLTHRLSHFKLG